MLIKFDSVSENEGFARNVIASFLLPLNPGIGELTDIKTAVSEAVTNAIVHGYPDTVGEVTMLAETDGENVHIVISDSGVGINDLEAALEPFYTTKPDDERSGMGFTIIKTFMDEVKVISKQNAGTIVDMTKRLSSVA
jgi:stage II sporulation protein AB (anti-sigma F factor)